MQRFLYDIFNRVKDDRFVLEFRGRARRVLEKTERGKAKKERKKSGSKWKLRKSNKNQAEVRNSTKVLSFKNGKTPLRLRSGSRESLNRLVGAKTR